MEAIVTEKAEALTEKERTGVTDMFRDKRLEELKDLFILLNND